MSQTQRSTRTNRPHPISVPVTQPSISTRDRPRFVETLEVAA